jgi:dienelactone hydrolase
MNPLKPASILALALGLGGAWQSAHGQIWEPNQSVERTIVLERERVGAWLVMTPENFERDAVYPVLLVFGGGTGSLTALSRSMSVFDPACRKRGWLVVGLVTPEGVKPTEPRTADVLRVIQEVSARVRIEGGKVHVAGPSNGGVAAFAFASERPDLVASVTVYPGHAADVRRLGRLRDVPVRMFVGSDDIVEWTQSSRETLEAGKALGLNVELDTRPAQGHMIGDLNGDALLDMLEPFRPRLGTLTLPEAEVARALDELHVGAHLAAEARYFAAFAPEGVFLGTDASERWTVDQFRAYAAPIFAKGKGWSYWPRERHVGVMPGGQIAWFDELLDNAKYGTARGSGVLRREGERWLVVQYNLSFPIPNGIADRVTRMIRVEEEKNK